MIDIGFNKHHPGWPRFKAMLDGKIQALREKNDSAALTAEQTAGIRGEISGLKQLIITIETAPVDDTYNP
jgi:hypothetical protein